MVLMAYFILIESNNIREDIDNNIYTKNNIIALREILNKDYYDLLKY
jgi:hypothetical protein